MIEFSDFECSYCGRVAPVIRELLKGYPDQIRFHFKHTPLPIHPNAPLAHEAALAAGAQGKFWEMHDLLFANRNRLEMEDLVRYAEQLGLDTDAFRSALKSRLYRPVVEQDLIEARGFGVTATPTFFINGRRLVGAQSLAVFKAIIDERLDPAKKALGAESAVEPAARVQQIKIDRAPARGSPQAPVTIVEFSDFQCAFCARAAPVLRALLREYPERVKWVFKHFPLDFHRDAPLAHEAALAAGEQGKFWEMHDLIFANQKAMKRDDLIQWARQLGLDVDRFLVELDSGRFREIVEADKEEAARLAVNGSPTFFINGKRLVGARPLADFKELVEQELSGGPKKTEGARARKDKELPQTQPDPLPAKGPADAPLTLVWFSDLQSPLTPPAAQLVQRVMDAYPGKIRLIFRHRPLEFHLEARLAHQAVLAAGAQGKFWEMHDLIVANQKGLGKEDLIRHAIHLGLDKEKFVAAMEGRIYLPAVERDLAEAQQRQVRGAPVFFVNTRRIDGLQPLARFKEVIEAELGQVGASSQ